LKRKVVNVTNLRSDEAQVGACNFIPGLQTRQREENALTMDFTALGSPIILQSKIGFLGLKVSFILSHHIPAFISILSCRKNFLFFPTGSIVTNFMLRVKFMAQVPLSNSKTKQNG
jgi:hypothetical protein